MSAPEPAGVLAPRCPRCGWEADPVDDTPANQAAMVSVVREHKAECSALTVAGETLTEAERLAIRRAGFYISSVTDQHLAAFERILADRLAAQRADLTARLARVEALADEWERLAGGNEAARGKPTKVAGYYRRCAHMLRAALTGDHP